MKNLQEKKIEANIYNYQIWIEEIDPEILKKRFDKLLSICEYEMVSFSEHYFPVQGYTCFWLLGESHLAIHTFPDDQKSYLELSGCNRAKNIRFIEICETLYPNHELHKYAPCILT